MTDNVLGVVPVNALFSEFECQQIRGQVDIWDAIAEVEHETVAAPEFVEPVGDGTLFPVRLTDSPVDGALFGLTI